LIDWGKRGPSQGIGRFPVAYATASIVVRM